MKINKVDSVISRISYSKVFRAPKWVISKIFNRAIPKDKLCDIKMRFGHTISLYPTQNYLKNVVINKAYHDDNIFLVGKFLKPNSVIIDVGANIGLYGCAYAQLYKHLNPTIIAIEAVDTNFKLLEKNIANNQFKNFHAINIALGDKPGMLEFMVPADDSIGNFIGTNIEESTGPNKKGKIVKKVKMDTLDNIMKDKGIDQCDFIKIDIEGAELFMLNGSKEFISKTRPVIQFEYNQYWLESVGVSFKDFNQYFQLLDYVLYIEKKGSFEEIVAPDSFIVSEQLVDLLAVPRLNL